mmetsp:Transcript_104761/g.240218  ORF Transcript_104761/g.240218 Transcript_104761/m.240218 type:complete len:218 (+) Transcript_104761:375-1028(+)
MLKIRRFDGVCDTNPTHRIKRQHHFHERQRCAACAGAQSLQWGHIHTILKELLQEGSALLVLDLLDLPSRGSSYCAHNNLNLMLRAAALEQSFSSKHLCEDASGRPRINFRAIGTIATKHLGRSVPSRAHILGKWRGPACKFGVVLKHNSGQTKVADLQVALTVHQQVPGLQIPMYDSSRVHVFQSAKNLIDEKLVMVISQLLVRLKNRSQVGLHER